MSQPPPIGIDLGTTNSLIATAEAGEFEVLTNDRGGQKTPSVLSYDWDAEAVHVGHSARNRSVSHPSDTIHSIKRWMGTEERFALGPDEYRPEAISALVLQKLRRDAAEALGRDVINAVVTVPAYFTDRERKATKKAGEIAGLTVDRIITEPTAACLAYGLGATSSETVFVYDLGGGTFDCSLVELSDGMIDVLGVDGATDLGGDDYDGLVVEWLCERITEEHGHRPARDSPEVESRLFDAARTAKHELSSRTSTKISLPYLDLADGDTVTVEQQLGREDFEQLVGGPTEETLAISRNLLENLDIPPTAVDRVLLVGGSTRMPIVSEAVTDLFGQSPEQGIDPDLVVALGATAQSCIIHDRPIPAASSADGLTVAETSSSGGVIDDDSQPVLLDVLPQTIGIKFKDDPSTEPYFQPIVPKGESVPAQVMTSTRPASDNQTHSTFEIYQGNAGTLAENQKLDEFTLGPYPPKPKSEHIHRLGLRIDENGIIYASAVDGNHDVRKDVTVEAALELSDETIARIRGELPPLHG